MPTDRRAERPVSLAAGTGDGLSQRLNEIVALADRRPADDPAVAEALAEVMQLLGTVDVRRPDGRGEQVTACCEWLVGRLPADHPLALFALLMGQALKYMQALVAGDTDRADAMLIEMIRSAEAVPPGHPLRPFALSGVATAYIERHSISGDLRNIEVAKQTIDKALDAAAEADGPFAPGGKLHAYLLHVRGHVLMVWNVYDPQLPRVNDAIADLERALAEAGQELAARYDMTTGLETARVMRQHLLAPLGPGRPLGEAASTAFGQVVDTAEAMGPGRPEYPIVAAQAASGLALRALSTGDVTFLNRAIAMLAEASVMPNLALRERLKVVQLHGFALQTRYDMTRDPRDLSNAITLLEDARRTVGQDLGSPYASSVLLSLAFAYRTRSNEALGDIDRAVRFGLAGLREHAGDVLLQDSDDHALHRARLASDDATDMARWFLARNRPEAAVGAIELGRGMVLHAATSGGSVADALAQAGQWKLAAAWAARAGGSVPRERDGAGEAGDDLRHQAMRALEGTVWESALLSPPTLDDITAALRRGGADLLAYLLPQEYGGSGMSTGLAVLVNRRGAVRWIPLPRLRVGKASMADDFQVARRAVEHADNTTVVGLRANWRRTLDAVCDWAWAAVIGPLLTAAGDAIDSGAYPAGPPRVVLVAIGELGLIPWHAARMSRDGSPPRYACQEAIFSYASSARQFIDASRRGVRPWPQAPVLISDSEGYLASAALEIAHLYTAYYGDGKVFGSVRAVLPADAPGALTVGPGDVLAALPNGSAPGASLLHLGCHGSVTVPVLAASLVLGVTGGGDEIAVSVRDILRQARTAPPSQSDAGGGLVVLAACLTDVTESDYDEALTLAAAFLAAGSSGVVAARWAIPDDTTMVFMAAFHHFLNGPVGDPARALREAQLWMLDPAREIPAAWPDPLRQKATAMAASSRGTKLAGIEAWAAFTYQGR